MTTGLRSSIACELTHVRYVAPLRSCKVKWCRAFPAATLTVALFLNACDMNSPPDAFLLPESADRHADLSWRPVQVSALLPLQVHENGRMLVDAQGDPVFLLGEALWAAPWKLGRTEFVDYLVLRSDQQFNAIAIYAFSHWYTTPNVYGDAPFARSNGEWLTSEFVTTDGDQPTDATQYDYWDHLDYIVDRAAASSMYVLLSPLHGRYISGPWSGDALDTELLTPAEIYSVGRWFGDRYGDRSNIIWIVGADRSPVTVRHDYRSGYRALAEGISDGVNGDHTFDSSANHASTLMTYWPRKWAPNSSYWFHFDDWLDFNSVQDMPRDQVDAIRHDWHLQPYKPTFLFEGRYEGYAPEWTDLEARFQAYQSVMAGGFGHLYGHETAISLGPDWYRQAGDEHLWKQAFAAPGASQMRHLVKLMNSLTHGEFLERIPDHELILGVDHKLVDTVTNRVVASRDERGTFAMIYVTSGGPISIDMQRLSSDPKLAYGYSPHTGEFLIGDNSSEMPVPVREGLSSGVGAPPLSLEPHGASGSDRVLILTSRPW